MLQETQHLKEIETVESRTMDYSKVTMSVVMMADQANLYGNIHGGEILKVMDTAAGVAAHKHARSIVVTAMIDEVTFHLPIRVGNLVTYHAQVIYAGKTSMEVAVNVTIEDLYKDQSTQKALTAFFTMVAIGKDGVPKPVPSLQPLTEEERRLFEQGRKRYLRHKKIREQIGICG